MPDFDVVGEILDPIGASLAAKEILVLLAEARRLPSLSGFRLPDSFQVGTMPSPRYQGRQVFVKAWLAPADITGPVDRFIDHVARSVATAFAIMIPSDDAHFVEMEIPQGLDAAGHAYCGLWLRCVIDLNHPIRSVQLGGEPAPEGVWSRPSRYYNVSIDQWAHAACGIALRCDMVALTAVDGSAKP